MIRRVLWFSISAMIWTDLFGFACASTDVQIFTWSDGNGNKCLRGLPVLFWFFRDGTITRNCVGVDCSAIFTSTNNRRSTWLSGRESRGIANGRGTFTLTELAIKSTSRLGRGIFVNDEVNLLWHFYVQSVCRAVYIPSLSLPQTSSCVNKVQSHTAWTQPKYTAHAVQST